jgi:hypothetical protein
MLVLQIVFWVLGISMFVAAIAMTHIGIGLLHRIFEEFNSTRPASEQVSLYGFRANFIVLEVIEQHRLLFPYSDKPSKMWFYSVGGMILIAAVGGLVVLANVIGLVSKTP